MSSLTAAAEVLLHARRPSPARTLAARERRVEAVAAAAFVGAAVGLATCAPAVGLPWIEMAALMAAYAVLAQVRFVMGDGFTMPTQLGLVPILLLLPPAIAPAMVGCALLAGRVPSVLARAAAPERLLTSLADGWYMVAPAVLLAVVAPRGALVMGLWPLWLAALALQLGGDLVTSTLREALGSGVRPGLHARVVGQIAVVDVLLSPIGVLAALASRTQPYAFAMTLPLVAGFALFARERAARVSRALALIDELDRERKRVAVAQRRIGEAVAANLDRPALERIIVTTATELLEADGGRLRADPLAGCAAESPGAPDADPGLEDALAAVELSVTRRGGLTEATADRATAIGLPIPTPDGSLRVLAVARYGRGFAGHERELLRTLAEQAAVCLGNLALHETVRRLAVTDELTGLANHRHFQESLAHEVARAGRLGVPLALLMLDIDDFKLVNDRHGHQQGDAVLRAVADVVRAKVRAIDLPARYGGEELAVILPHMDVDRAATVGQRLRTAIAAARVSGRGGCALTVTASIGIAALGSEVASAGDLVRAADAALYRAKRAGKNCVEVAPALATG